MQQMMTIGALLAWAIPLLAAVGIDTPRLDAELLLAHVCGKSRGWVWAHADTVLSTEETEHFRALCARRAQREPLPYLLGEWEFYGRSFFVSPAVLIPRPETELLVETVLAWARSHSAARIADIGAGSGAIAVTLAAESPELHVYAVELSSAALALAVRNAARHEVTARITFLHGDLLQPLHNAGALPFDAIVANLPYIPEGDYAGLMPEVRDFEPATALRGGADGLDLIRRLIADSPAALRRDGLLALEIGIGQSETVRQLLAAAHWRHISVIVDYAGIPRHLVAERPQD